MVLQDKNGTFTVVTPIINAENKVTALIFGSARNKDHSYFRLIDRNTPQLHLTEYGARKLQYLQKQLCMEFLMFWNLIENML